MSIRKGAAIAGWNILVIAGLLVILDLTLRFTPYNYARNPFVGNPPNYYVADAELGFAIARNFPGDRFVFRGPGHAIFSNDLGCFDNPIELRPDEPYIIAIGDSFTWGYNPLEAKWTSIIERRTGIRVLKCGVPGTGTRYQLLFLKRLLKSLPQPPAIVIHLYDTTDFNDDFTFPGETVVDGQRIEDFSRISVSDGRRTPAKRRPDGGWRKQAYDDAGGYLRSRSVLYSILKTLLRADTRIERRRLVLEGNKPAHLDWKYEFNLLLLDEGSYPYVAGKLAAHLDTLREMRDFVHGLGARYALFHTNSFRLPEDRPLVRRLREHLESTPEFLGWMPELARHPFDPHWNAKSEARVAEVMLDRLKRRRLIPRPTPVARMMERAR